MPKAESIADLLSLPERWGDGQGLEGNEARLRVYPGAAHGMGHFGPHQHTDQGEQTLQAIEAFYNEHLAA